MLRTIKGTSEKVKVTDIYMIAKDDNAIKVQTQLVTFQKVDH